MRDAHGTLIPCNDLKSNYTGIYSDPSARLYSPRPSPSPDNSPKLRSVGGGRILQPWDLAAGAKCLDHRFAGGAWEISPSGGTRDFYRLAVTQRP
ncbi:MAG: hypothetical protein WCJ66_19195 [Verrucomicrobiota bacterium]